jgi:flagellar basal-body rod protein FlgG
MKGFGTEVASGVYAPTGVEIGSGVRVGGTAKIFTPGELQNTTNPLDIAITGEGFLEVTLANGDKRYTRDGALRVSPEGILVTNTGYPIEPSITIPDGATITIEKGGAVNITDTSGVTSVAGTIQLARFPNASGLSSEGDNFYAETEASGSPVTGTPGDNGFGTILAGFLEKSNVQMVSELINLITAQRAYEINSRAIKAGDDMLQTANQLIR